MIIKEKRGITLIALVITIIVLLILAGITITTLVGENGILNKTHEAKDGTEIAQMNEELQLAISGLAYEYHTSDDDSMTFRDYIFSTDEGKGQEKLKAELGVSNLIFDTTNHQITYKLIVVEIDENGKTKKVGEIETSSNNQSNDYSNDVKTKLAINPNGSTDAKKSPYVKYNNNIYRVLYNDSEHGIEIISNNRIGYVTLGNQDPAELVTTEAGQKYVTDNNITLVGEVGEKYGQGDYSKRSIWSYNNAIATLNYMAEKCRIVNDEIVDGARCVGSLPNNKLYKNTIKYERAVSWFSPNYDNRFEQGEENLVYKNEKWTLEGTPNYASDKTQMESLNIWNIESSYWLASRYNCTTSEWSNFNVCRVKNDGSLGTDESINGIYKLNSYNYSESFANGLRPVLHLAYSVKIVANNSCDGSTPEKAYLLTNT